MAHFYGSVKGARGEATRLGGKGGGMKAIAAGWEGAIRTTVYHDEATGNDMYRVELIPWGSSGGSARVISEGVLNAKEMN